MPTQTLQVMVVEDELLLLEAVSKKLKLAGFAVQGFTSGQQALEALKTMPKLPDAIWLDYYLKDMTGLNFMETVHQSPAWSYIPVLVASNSATPDKVHAMVKLGVKRYVLKADHRLEEIVELLADCIAADKTLQGDT